ncbi:hypothetical protein Patl1_32678 [Pistacia atlantica]|uniref:Uncharacterized protein n=1 Tax=Pistacia atlantica TaxID=434234 RepID=A0ACC1AQ49_9ROSI|nr:hypothetical protein Patl1_32678 [Pistacia atlantica]
MSFRSSFISAAVSFAIASLGLLPRRALTVVVSKSLGSSWSGTAVEGCLHSLVTVSCYAKCALSRNDRVQKGKIWIS